MLSGSGRPPPDAAARLLGVRAYADVCLHWSYGYAQKRVPVCTQDINHRENPTGVLGLWRSHVWTRQQPTAGDPEAGGASSSPGLCPSLLASVPKVCAASHVARKERARKERESRPPEMQGRKKEAVEGGGGVGWVAGGTRSRTQEVERDEEAGETMWWC